MHLARLQCWEGMSLESTKTEQPGCNAAARLKYLVVSFWPSSTGVSPTDCLTSQEPFTILGMSLKAALRRSVDSASSPPATNLSSTGSQVPHRKGNPGGVSRTAVDALVIEESYKAQAVEDSRTLRQCTTGACDAQARSPRERDVEGGCLLCLRV